MLLLVLLSALWAFAFYYERQGVGGEAFGQRDAVDMYILEAEGAMARLAIEVHVVVVLVASPVAVAQFIVEHSPSVFERVRHVVFKEKREHTEYARLVHLQVHPLHVRQADGMVSPAEHLVYDDAVGSSPYSLVLKLSYYFLRFHFLRLSIAIV